MQKVQKAAADGAEARRAPFKPVNALRALTLPGRI
jgi:hypothetical protein